ncbi:MAG: HEAT repeat domain-containing protein [Pirellulales bacterium]|nr:HEAT repeat domain-containing protein [Pirellulales bacterium]
MPAPLELTFQTLANSRNEAATGVLLAALDSPVPAIVNGALHALMMRRSKAGHLGVLRRWHRLSSHQLDVLRAGRGRIGAALRDALVSDDPQLVKNACEFSLAFSEYDVLPTLVTIAEGSDSRRAEPALVLVEQLVSQLSRLLCGGRDAHERRDPEIIRRNVLESLERSLERYRRHRRDALVEAFVTLAGVNSPLLLLMIDSPHHPCYDSVTHALLHSENPGVLHLLLELLETTEAPATILGTVSRRTDAPFVRAMSSLPLEGAGATLKKNLGRIAALAFLEPPQHIDQLPEAQQAAAMRLMMFTAINTGEKLLAAEQLLKSGSPAGRLAACEAAAAATGDQANRLILMAAEDADPAVQAAAARRLHERRIPGAMQKLLEMIDSADPLVAAAAREGLAELNFENYLARYDNMDEESRRSCGEIALKVDLASVARLRVELDSPSRHVRLRAVEIIELLELAPQISDALVERLDDSEHLVRTAAAEALRRCTGVDVRNALIASLSDRSGAVQRAALASLESLGVEADLPAVEQEQPAGAVSACQHESAVEAVQSAPTAPIAPSLAAILATPQEEPA